MMESMNERVRAAVAAEHELTVRIYASMWEDGSGWASTSPQEHSKSDDAEIIATIVRSGYSAAQYVQDCSGNDMEYSVDEEITLTISDDETGEVIWQDSAWGLLDDKDDE